MITDPALVPIAASLNVTVGQLVLQYELMTGADIVIPRSHNAQHQTDNLNIYAQPWGLNETQIAAISGIHAYTKVCELTTSVSSFTGLARNLAASCTMMFSF